MSLFFKDFAWMLGLITSCASLDLIILVVHDCDLVIWLTTLLDACGALTFFSLLCFTLSVGLLLLHVTLPQPFFVA